MASKPSDVQDDFVFRIDSQAPPRHAPFLQRESVQVHADWGNGDAARWGAVFLDERGRLVFGPGDDPVGGRGDLRLHRSPLRVLPVPGEGLVLGSGEGVEAHHVWCFPERRKCETGLSG